VRILSPAAESGAERASARLRSVFFRYGTPPPPRRATADFRAAEGPPEPPQCLPHASARQIFRRVSVAARRFAPSRYFADCPFSLFSYADICQRSRSERVSIAGSCQTACWHCSHGAQELLLPRRNASEDSPLRFSEGMGRRKMLWEEPQVSQAIGLSLNGRPSEAFMPDSE